MTAFGGISDIRQPAVDVADMPVGHFGLVIQLWYRLRAASRADIVRLGRTQLCAGLCIFVVVEFATQRAAQSLDRAAREREVLNAKA